MASEQPDAAGQRDTPSNDGALIDAARKEAEAARLPTEDRIHAGGRRPSGVWLGGEHQASSLGSWIKPDRPGDAPVPANTAANVPSLGISPDSFTGYRILREIHRGGQGVVFQAIQESTKRKVALKVMKEGPFATTAEQARFDREVQVLSHLNHPNIVAIHDKGEAAGCHYFVMDYIRGQPLDVWMASEEHPIRETLRLFKKICNAVNSAHLQGITHRDLKPGNIRVDDNGEPHVLDFGLAKVAMGPGGPTGAPGTMTATGQFVGSLPWASPEQAEGIPGKIDLRTDVYSLGVILYQMLTGKFPYDVIGNMRDVLDRIMRIEPIRPSEIRSTVDDEVETIVLKCLTKERERRYQSAGEVGRDISHYLSGEPIEAKRDSTAYVLRKYLDRYRVAVVIATAFVVLVTAGLICSLTFWRQAVDERKQAEQARFLADERRLAAETSEAKAMAEAQRADREATAARQQAAIADSVNRLMHDVLARANRSEEGGNPNVKVRDVLDAASFELDKGRGGYEPEVEAAVRLTIGQTYRALGMYDEAEKHLRAALTHQRALFGNEDLGVADIIECLGLLAMDKGSDRIREAKPLLEEALAIRERLLGDESLAVATAMQNLGTVLDPEQAEPMLVDALSLRRRLLGEEDPAVAETLGSLAAVAMHKGEWTSAEDLLRQALSLRRKSLGDEHLDVAANLNQLGDLVAYRRDYAAADPYYREALAIYRKLLGEEHPLVATAASNLGRILHLLGDPAAAEPLLRNGLDIRRKMSREHPQLAYSERNLGLVLCDLGNYSEAETLLREALAVFDEHGYNSGDDCVARVGLSNALIHLNRFAEADIVLTDTYLRLGVLTEDRNAVVRASASIPQLRRQAVELLIDLNERWEAIQPGQGHAAKAAEWRADLEQLAPATQPASEVSLQTP